MGWRIGFLEILVPVSVPSDRLSDECRGATLRIPGLIDPTIDSPMNDILQLNKEKSFIS